MGTVLVGVDQYWGSLLAAFPLHTDQGRDLDHSPEGDGEERLPAAFLLDTHQEFLDHSLEGDG